MSIEIVNIKDSTYDIYIGRGSIYGNPYKIGVDGNRKEVCDKHLEYIKNCLLNGKFKYEDLKLLNNKKLGCYCAPNRCHGDNYKMLLDEINKYFKVIVAGSRNYNNKEFIYNKLDILLSKVNKPVQIVSGLAKGVDSIAVDYAQDRDLSLKTFEAHWDIHGKRAGILRNIEMGDYADALIAFRLDNSVGTSHMIDYAKSKHLKVRIYKLSSTKINVFIKINNKINIKDNRVTIFNNLDRLLKNYDNISITTDNKKLKEFIEVNIYNNACIVEYVRKKADITNYDEVIFITLNNSITEYENYVSLNKLNKTYKVIDIKINDISLFDYKLLSKYFNKYGINCDLNNKAVTTNSIYLKFQNSSLGSIRVSDHLGKSKYAYKWNIGSDIYEKRVDKQDTYVRYYYPITDEISIFKDIIKYKDDLND